MKPVIFLRIASVLTFVHSLLHTIGGVFGKAEPGASERAVEAMQANVFPVMGLTRSYWSFYRGLGLGISIFLIVEAVVFWQLSSLARNHYCRLRPVYATFMVGYLLFAMNSYEYFFPPPVVIEILIALCLGLAIVTSQSADTANV
jgi:hypothetical protein